MRSNEAGFLDLLHLLDPEHYGRDDLEPFTELIELRDQLAFTYQALTPELQPIELSLFGDELKEHFPADKRLAELFAAAEGSDDDSRPGHPGIIHHLAGNVHPR